MLQLLLFSLTLCAASQKLEGESYTWTDEKLGVSITLPDKKWELSDRSRGVARVLIFSPSKDIRRRRSTGRRKRKARAQRSFQFGFARP